MKFSFTNTSKAKNILKEGGFNVSEMEKGSAAELKLTEEQMLKIVRGDQDNVFEILNNAGKLLKDSLLTRSTGHKELDFSTIQSTSYINLTKYCYKQLPKIQIPDDNTGEISEEVSEEINIRISKIWRDLYQCVKYMEGNKEIMAVINKEMTKPSIERKKDFAEVIKILHEDYKLDENHVVLPQKIDGIKEGFSKRVGRYAKDAFYMGARELDLLSLGLKNIKPEDTPIGSITRGGLGTGMLVGCLILGLATYLVGSQVIETKQKRATIKLQEGLAKIIKEMHSLSKYVMENVKNDKNTKPQESKVTKEQKELLAEFLEEQKKIWKPYTRVSGRGYYELFKDKGSREKHWSLGKKVSNQKTSSIGKLKLGLANQWMKIKII